MTTVQAILSFMQGVESYRRQVANRLPGSPLMLRLHYLGGHPGIWEPEPFWVGRVGNLLRLVGQHGHRSYDLPLDRIRGLSCQGGRLLVRYEPTFGLSVTLEFASDEQIGDGYQKLLQLMLLGA